MLQNDDVIFEPAFPAWKTEAIQSMTMVCVTSLQSHYPVDSGDYQGTYTKIFLQFPQKFWFDTQVSIS